jgi:hypothetical protein
VPVTAVLYASHDERFQLGRLVERFLTLGTLRLAALYDLHKVEHASELLREVETELDGLNKGLPDKLKAGGESAGENIAKDILKISTRLARIAHGEEGQGAQKIIGGLPHRTERSNYYWQAFNLLTPDLRIGRIEGSQPYDQFIRHASGSSYNFIRMVGVRYQRLQNAIAEIDEKIQTEESVRTQKSTAKGTKESAKFLEAAEWGFWFALFPYYSSSFILHNVLGHNNVELINKKLDKLLHSQAHEQHDLTSMYVSAIMFVIGLEGANKFRVTKGVYNKSRAAAQKICDFKQYSQNLVQRKAKCVSVKFQHKKMAAQDWKNQKIALLKDRTIMKPKEHLTRIRDRIRDYWHGPK